VKRFYALRRRCATRRGAAVAAVPVRGRLCELVGCPRRPSLASLTGVYGSLGGDSALSALDLGGCGVWGRARQRSCCPAAAPRRSPACLVLMAARSLPCLPAAVLLVFWAAAVGGGGGGQRRAPALRHLPGGFEGLLWAQGLGAQAPTAAGVACATGTLPLQGGDRSARRPAACGAAHLTPSTTHRHTPFAGWQLAVALPGPRLQLPTVGRGGLPTPILREPHTRLAAAARARPARCRHATRTTPFLEFDSDWPGCEQLCAPKVRRRFCSAAADCIAAAAACC